MKIRVLIDDSFPPRDQPTLLLNHGTWWFGDDDMSWTRLDDGLILDNIPRGELRLMILALTAKIEAMLHAPPLVVETVTGDIVYTQDSPWEAQEEQR